MPFPLAVFLGAVILFVILDGRLWQLHVPIISDLAKYSCVERDFGYFGMYPDCQYLALPSFWYFVGAQLVTLFTCWFGLIPFLISYIKEKSVENSFSEMKLLPLHKQWKFLVCVGVLIIAWCLFWIEYFLR